MHSPIASLLCLLVLIAIPTLCSAQSVGYSLSIRPPESEMKSGEMEIAGGIGLFPEVRPKEAGRLFSPGGDLAFRIAPSEGMSVGIKGWVELSDGWSSYGIEAEGAIPLANRKSSTRVMLIPRVALLLREGSLVGIGAGLSFAMAFTPDHTIMPYAAIGPMAGWNLAPLPTGYLLPPTLAGSSRPGEWGYGLIANAGARVRLSSAFSLLAELAGVIEVNRFEFATQAMLLPSVTIGWRL